MTSSDVKVQSSCDFKAVRAIQSHDAKIAGEVWFRLFAHGKLVANVVVPECIADEFERRLMPEEVGND